jgi:hypothetical protein
MLREKDESRLSCVEHTYESKRKRGMCGRCNTAKK